MWELQVGERIKQLRKEQNLSRTEFGRLIGLSEQSVGKIERGKHNITGAVIAKICNATDVSSDYIIFGSINPDVVVSTLNGLSNEQIQIALEIIMKIAKFINTKNGNNALIQEVLRRHQTAIRELFK